MTLQDPDQALTLITTFLHLLSWCHIIIWPCESMTMTLREAHIPLQIHNLLRVSQFNYPHSWTEFQLSTVLLQECSCWNENTALGHSRVKQPTYHSNVAIAFVERTLTAAAIWLRHIPGFTGKRLLKSWWKLNQTVTHYC